MTWRSMKFSWVRLEMRDSREAMRLSVCFWYSSRLFRYAFLRSRACCADTRLRSKRLRRLRSFSSSTWLYFMEEISLGVGLPWREPWTSLRSWASGTSDSSAYDLPRFPRVARWLCLMGSLPDMERRRFMDPSEGVDEVSSPSNSSKPCSMKPEPPETAANCASQLAPLAPLVSRLICWEGTTASLPAIVSGLRVVPRGSGRLV
mmetsp:Transcript_42820/g.137035  ORF Transcript_42820/g.137035 Transcript_42820/m.137035 type:complete len:204 (+) Transcript_42820:455-1066(+)